MSRSGLAGGKMADFSLGVAQAAAAAAAGVGAGSLKPEVFADAVQRARQIAAKIGSDTVPGGAAIDMASAYGFPGQKRPLEDADVPWTGPPPTRAGLELALSPPDNPDSKKMAPQSDPIGAQLAAIQQQQSGRGGDAPEMGWSPPPRFDSPDGDPHWPPSHHGGGGGGGGLNPRAQTEEMKIPDKMVGFIIGRGGEQVSRLQTETGCKIQISPDAVVDATGLMERTCMLMGPPEAIQHAKSLIDQIIERCRNGGPSENGADGMVEIIVPADKVGLVIGKGGETIRQLQDRAGVKMVMIQDNRQNSGVDKPLRITGDPYKVQQAKEMVIEFLRKEDHRERFGEFAGRTGGRESVKIAVPRFAVGVVIGRSGDMIKKLQNEAGVRIQFQPDDGSGPERMAQIMGVPENCQRAAMMIIELINGMQMEGREGPPGGMGPRGRGGRGRGFGDWSPGPPGGMQDQITYTVPAEKCGIIIGKGGETIKHISQTSGARVELQRNPPPNTDPNIRIFLIRGSPQQVDHARHLMDEKMGLGGPSAFGGAPAPFGQGPYGQGPPGPPHQNGPGQQAFAPQAGGWPGGYQPWAQGQQQQQQQQQQPQQNPAAQDPSKSGDPNSAAWAAYYAQYYGQQPTQHNPAHTADPSQPAGGQNGQPDYTKAWEEYYKKIGQQNPSSQQPDYSKAWEEYYKKQAEAQGQGSGGAAPGSQQQQQQQQGQPGQQGGQPDYSAAWAEYYRQQSQQAYYAPGGAQGNPNAPQGH
ncbi:far upstream element-binding protein 1-like isoform X5 [Lethenteron reissneri]|uniref:far upstream element-binding protein 1-like isoform X5 n=1 Tax=Lethenteron reissneri TaxID=7753 RepID=UPI002AB6389E|nr:far upstream element-binding protein 1-like isoform X5 [Lethenteron reissneri]